MFLESDDFPFTKTLEANWRVVRGELAALAASEFTAFPEKHLYETGWDVLGLYFFGRKWLPNTPLCPQTTGLVEAVPGMLTAGFSRPEPGTHIKPHVGYTGSVLRCHLGVVVPEGCALRVGDEVRNWEEGKTLVFDDTTEHEAWNESGEARVVLLIDFKKPGAQLDLAELQKELRQREQQPAGRGRTGARGEGAQR